ncbi:MAG: hypothetical protein ACOX5M_00625 [Bacillota bacterium]
MTHSLHRRGAPETLENDYVLLVTPAVGINHVGSKEKLQKILDVIWEIGPTNIGSYEVGTIFTGSTLEEIKTSLSDKPRVRCAFDSCEKITEVVRRIKEMDLGLSVTVSGLTDKVQEMSKRLGIEPNSVNLSLGIMGRTDLLPPEWVLEITTMCGHGMISASLVEKMVSDLKKGRITLDKAAETLARPCVCGIFNVARAKKLLADRLACDESCKAEGE